MHYDQKVNSLLTRLVIANNLFQVLAMVRKELTSILEAITDQRLSPFHLLIYDLSPLFRDRQLLAQKLEAASFFSVTLQHIADSRFHERNAIGRTDC